MSGNSFILHRAIPVTSVVGYARKKGNSLHRGYNPAMKNKRSDTPKVCWMQHGCDAEDVDMSLKNKTCQPASGAQDSRASLELHSAALLHTAVFYGAADVMPLISFLYFLGVTPVLWRKARMKLAEEQKAQ